MEKEIGIGTASKLLGISVSTLKRLCDENLIPSIRTPGGHRRFDRAEVELVGQRLVGNAMQLNADFTAGLHEKIEFLLLTGNENSLHDLLKTQLSNDQPLPALLDQCLMPTLHRVLASEATSATVKQVVNYTVLHVLNQLSVADGDYRSDAPVVIGGSIGSTFEESASRMVEATLRSARIHALHVDACVELPLLAQAAQQLSARGVWLAQLLGPFSELIAMGEQLRRLLLRLQDSSCLMVAHSSVPRICPHH